jgi:tRNA (guanine37-N1)-methyltransferase
MVKFDIITLFPQLFTEHLANLPFKKAVEKNLAEYNLWNLRNFSINKYGSVDDEPYGGGVGMILMVEPIFKALSEIYGREEMEKMIKNGKHTIEKNRKIIVLSPRGTTFNQKKAEELSKCNEISLICGRYEGIDARVEEYLATDVISIGNYILSGGEIPALAIMESVTRIIPGVLEKEEATKYESFSSFSRGKSKFIEYPQYTRPENFLGLKVPNTLLSGNHKEIERWRKNNSGKFNNLQ